MPIKLIEVNRYTTWRAKDGRLFVIIDTRGELREGEWVDTKVCMYNVLTEEKKWLDEYEWEAYVKEQKLFTPIKSND